MSDPIERDRNYGVPHPRWTTGLTEADRPVSSLVSQEYTGRDRVKGNLPARLISFGTAALVILAFAKNLSGPSRWQLSSQYFSEHTRTPVTTSGVMSSQRSGILDHRFVDCTGVRPKQLRRTCW